MISSECKYCKSAIADKRPRMFCNRKCRGSWQRINDKPVTKEWLHQKYIVEKMDCPEIAKMVGRDQKSVYNWLVDFGIPTRPRGSSHEKNPKFAFWKSGEKSPFAGRNLTEEHKRIISKRNSGSKPKLCGENHPQHGKTKELNFNWKGGSTPERQSFYSSRKWKETSRSVYQRDDWTCQKCGKKTSSSFKRTGFSIHHIVSFMDDKELRAEKSNLVLLCRPCHLWVHSRENTNKEFIKEKNHE